MKIIAHVVCRVDALPARSREPSLRDEILVFVVMSAMFLGLLVVVNVTRTMGRKRLYYMTFEELPLM